MGKTSKSSLMIFFTIATGVLAFPIAYDVCLSEDGSPLLQYSQKRFLWSASGYAAAMMIGATLGMLLDFFYARRPHLLKIDFNLVPAIAVIFALELMFLVALKPSF